MNLDGMMDSLFDDAFSKCRDVFKNITGRDFINGYDIITCIDSDGESITYRLISGDDNTLTVIGHVNYILNFGENKCV